MAVSTIFLGIKGKINEFFNLTNDGFHKYSDGYTLLNNAADPNWQI